MNAGNIVVVQASSAFVPIFTFFMLCGLKVLQCAIWLIGWSVGLIDWLFDWMNPWLTHSFTGQLYFDSFTWQYRTIWHVCVQSHAMGSHIQPSCYNKRRLRWFVKRTHPRGLCNIGYPSETHLKPISHKISCAHNVFSGCLIVLKFYTEHGSDTAVLWAKFQNDWTI